MSRITGGAKANTLGQIAQSYVSDYLTKKLGVGYIVVRNGNVNTPEGRIPFDIIVSKKNNLVAIEVTFQVTTNSVIERKAGQVVARKRLLHKQGNYIAYIIDGAGNFQRKSATTTICNNSDCTVAYSEQELDVLINFIKEKLK